MRAMCGAIITAAALIGLGMTAQGIGTRYTMERAYYSDFDEKSPKSEEGKDKADAPARIAKPARVKFGDMDRPLSFILVFLTSMAIVGLAIAFLGLVYHHLRRDREYELQRQRHSLESPQRTSV